MKRLVALVALALSACADNEDAVEAVKVLGWSGDVPGKFRAKRSRKGKTR